MRVRLRPWQPALWLLLLISVGACLSSITYAQPRAAYDCLLGHPSSAVVPTQLDFDADRVADDMTFTASGGQPDIEIYLSSSRTVLILPIDAAALGTGSLEVRDLDSDGDEDLVWQGVPPLSPATVIVWFNDGTGQFLRVAPLGPLPSQPLPGLSRGPEFHRSPSPLQVCSLQQTSSPLGVLSSTRATVRVGSARRESSAGRPAGLRFPWVPAGRAPPGWHL